MKTVWILGDQLSPTHAALARTRPGQSRVLMIESKARGSVLRYHQLKLTLVYSAMRHFAAELRERGWEVDYRLIDETPSFEAGLQRHLETHRPDALVIAEPNSFPETDAITNPDISQTGLEERRRVLVSSWCATKYRPKQRRRSADRL